MIAMMIRNSRVDTPASIGIIGGGISGLAAAHYLARHRPDVKTILIEQDRRLGGKIVTEQVDGFVVEGGPDAFLSSKPRGIGLANELGLEARLQGTDEEKRRTWVMSGGHLHRLPEGLSGLVPSRLEPLLESDLFSPAGKERLRQEPAIPARGSDEDESLASFITRRFGHEVYDRMIEPLMAGIHAGDGEQLSLAATFPQLRRLEREWGSVIEGIRAANAGDTARAARPAFLSPIGGMGELVDAVLRHIPEVGVLTGTGVQGIIGRNAGFELRLSDSSRLQVRAVIVATPAFVAGRLLANVDQAMADALCAIPHVSSATVSLAYPAAQVPGALEGYGYVVPRKEGRPALAGTWSSTKFHHRAPEGHALIRVFIGRSGAEEALKGPDDYLVRLARDEVADVLGTREAPLFHRVFRWANGMPQYTMGHLERIATIEGRGRQHPGLFMAGNAFRGVGIPDCIESGERAARAAAEHVSPVAVDRASSLDWRGRTLE
jgi:oxygen-dependent protoporphyrinogen oxidase